MNDYNLKLFNEKGAFYINTNKQTIISFIDSSGNTYTGTVQLQRWDEPIVSYKFIKGIMQYINGDVYDGEWEQNNINNNLKSGKGIMKYTNGDVYDGVWRYDHRCKGNIVYKNNENYLEYDGKWESDIPDGYGKLTYKDKTQTPSGTTPYYTVNGRNIGGSSGGLAIWVDPKTNCGYYFEIVALTEVDVNVYNANATIKKLSTRLMAIPLKNEYIPLADVVYAGPYYEESGSGSRDNSIVPNNEIVEVRGKVKAKGKFAKFKRHIGPYIGFSSAGFIE